MKRLTLLVLLLCLPFYTLAVVSKELPPQSLTLGFSTSFTAVAMIP